jgi:rubrerythrin
MGKFGSIEDVLEFAIEREIEANEFYKGLSNRVKDTAMREVFENFAREELGHKAKLEAMKARGKKADSGESAIDLKISDYLVDVEPSEDMDYKDALILAMKKEKASFALYCDLSREVEGLEQKEMFSALAKEEARHKLRFELEYDEVVLKEG